MSAEKAVWRASGFASRPRLDAPGNHSSRRRGERGEGRQEGERFRETVSSKRFTPIPNTEYLIPNAMQKPRRDLRRVSTRLPAPAGRPCSFPMAGTQVRADGTLTVLDGAREAQAQVVVAVAGVVPVAVRGAAVPGVEAPATAPEDAERARTGAKSSSPPTAAHSTHPRPRPPAREVPRT